MSQRPLRAIVATLLASIALLFPAAASGQDETVPISSVNTDDYPTVTIDFAAPPTLRGGELVADEVTLSENGVELPFELRRTTAENLEVMLVVDISGSMLGPPIDQAKLAAESFVDRLPGGSTVALVTFGDEPQVVTPFTTDTAAVVDAIRAVEVDPAAETALYDATRLAIQQFPPSALGPRYVMVVTDGGDTASDADIGTAQAAVQAAGIPVFAVSLVTGESDPDALATLTGETGGGVVEASDPVGLAELTEQIAATITEQYQLTYTSAGSGRTTIEVTVERRRVTAVGSIAVTMPLVVEPTTQPTPTPTAVAPAEPTPQPAAPSPTIVAPERGGSWYLPVGATLVGLALVALFGFLLWPTRRRRNPLRGMAPVAGTVVRNSGGLLAGASHSLVRAAERIVTNRDGEARLAQRIDRAGIRMRPAEFVVMVGLMATVGFLMGLLVNAGVGLLVFAMVVVGAVLMLSIRGDKRSAQFEEQLPITLRMMSGGLRGGFSISQVVELVAREASTPTRDEFARLSVEENLGRDIADSFRDVARRMQSEDFKWVAEAVEINRTVGGDLAEVLENVSETIRTRQRIKLQIKTLSAEGRLSASILIAVPFMIFFGQLVVAPELPRELVNTGEGRVSIVIGLILMSIATVWMRRIVRLKY